MARAELDRLHDDLYVLACAVDDTEKDLASVGAKPSVDELKRMLEWLMSAAKPLRDRELGAPASHK